VYRLRVKAHLFAVRWLSWVSSGIRRAMSIEAKYSFGQPRQGANEQVSYSIDVSE
jgi:hypothetical protein